MITVKSVRTVQVGVAGGGNRKGEGFWELALLSKPSSTWSKQPAASRPPFSSW